MVPGSCDSLPCQGWGRPMQSFAMSHMCPTLLFLSLHLVRFPLPPWQTPEVPSGRPQRYPSGCRWTGQAWSLHPPALAQLRLTWAQPPALEMPGTWCELASGTDLGLGGC